MFSHGRLLILFFVPSVQLKVHIRDDCPSTEVHCEYKNLGCGEVV